MKRSDILSKESILANVNALEIYSQTTELKQRGNDYIGLCPLHNEKSPSFWIFGDRYKCFGCSKSGDIISFVQEYHKLNYIEALKWLKSCNFQSLTPNKPNNTKKTIQRQKLDIGWIDMKFTDRHKRYFGAYELDETFLNSMDIYALSKYAINGKIVKCPEKWFRVAYFAYDLEEIKVLTLGEGVPKEEKWKSFNIPNNYIWYYYKYKDGSCEDLFICKSNKDCAVMAKLGYCGVSVQNEDAKTLIGNKNKIEKICKHAYIVFGSDKQGKQASLDANKVLNWRYFNTKNYLLKENVNDPASLVEWSSMEILNKEIQKALKKWK